ncbi:MAG: NAD(P)-dependent oxidoreductase [Pseudomonadota bacterium]
MTELLIFEASLARIGDELSRRYPDVEPIAWSADGRLTKDGAAVVPSAINPKVGWISLDVLVAGKLEAYCEAVKRPGTIEWMQTLNAGLDHPVYAPLSAQGIRISKSSAQALPIAEYVLGYALYHFQRMDERAKQQAARQWELRPFPELSGSRWLIIGFGHIGRRIASRARAFEADIVAVRQSERIDPLADVTIGLSDLPQYLPTADVVVLACPHTDETDQLADDGFFYNLKTGGLLINIARGGLIDEDALLAGLERDQPARAVLDVFATEPLPRDHAFWQHPKVTVTPHTSNAGAGTLHRGDIQFLENLGHFLRGESIPDEVPTRSTA